MRPSRPVLLVPVLALAFAACGDGGDDDRAGEPRATVTATATTTPSPTAAGPSATLAAADGTEIGTVTLTEDAGAVVVRVEARNLEEGFHGLHIHETGRCDGADGFTTAGGHHTGDGGTHGTHDGDLPSLLADADGNARVEVRTARFTVAELDDADGAAMIVHAGPDNFGNIPSRYGSPDQITRNTGDSGERIACAVLFPAEGATASPAGTASPAETTSPDATPTATLTTSPTASLTASPS